MRSVLHLVKWWFMLVVFPYLGPFAYAQQPSDLNPIKGDKTSDRYEVNQTFGGQSFWKDNNIWVYNRSFAEKFGMPAGGIAEDIEGIEAAAFRIEDAGYRLCGMGGSADNCFPTQDRCMLDIYIDERKFPLPWVNPEQMADWYEYYNSAQWLRVPKNEDPLNRTTERIIPDKRFQGSRILRGVFADPDTKNEATIYGKDGFAKAAIMGYKRRDKGGLTMIVLDTLCDMNTNRSPRNELVLTTLMHNGNAQPGKVFHSIAIPKSFFARASERVAAYQKKTQEYLKGLYQSLGVLPKAQ